MLSAHGCDSVMLMTVIECMLDFKILYCKSMQFGILECSHQMRQEGNLVHDLCNMGCVT